MSEFSWETLMLARLLRKSYDAVLFYLLLGIIIFLLLFPFYWGFITSLKYEVEIYDFTGNFLVPKNPSLDNYLTVFTTSGYSIWFWNTTLVSNATTLISMVTTTM
ncbi:MAG: hypothetical protein KDE47_33955, partial [Caldilineaceae bacterium]|nr:hypothetical protein [Caldilineaceae bacterium]